jgi:hypothetical protein
MDEVTSDKDGRFIAKRGIGNGTFIATASFGGVPIENSVELQSGSSAEIKLGFSEVISIDGTVRDPSGTPIANASITPGFASIIGNDALLAKSDQSGRFVLTAPIARTEDRSLYSEVVVTAPGYSTQTAEAAPKMNVTLQKVPLSVISGIVLEQGPYLTPVELALERQATLKFEYNNTLYDVGFGTNSRIVNATFDQPSRSISIDLEGIQGPAGSSELTVPKDLLGGPFAIELDGIPDYEYKVSENATHSVISISHDHGLGRLTVQGATAVPEFPVPAITAGIVVALIVYWRRLKVS